MRRAIIGIFLLCVVGALFAPSAHADSVVLTFSGLKDLQAVGNYYNGGGPNNYGITFSSDVFAILPASKGGSGGFVPDPSGSAAIFFNGTAGTNVIGTMSVASGFSGGLSFFYTGSSTETVTVWSGANGTGTILAVMNLSANNGSCSGFPNLCQWTGVHLSFNGTAGSVTFSGQANGTAISDIKLGSSMLVTPEPSTMVLLGTGLLGTSLAGGWKALRRRGRSLRG